MAWDLVRSEVILLRVKIDVGGCLTLHYLRVTLHYVRVLSFLRLVLRVALHYTDAYLLYGVSKSHLS